MASWAITRNIRLSLRSAQDDAHLWSGRSDGGSLPIRNAVSICKSETGASTSLRISPASRAAIGNPWLNRIRLW